jgi:hypothetical protein
MALAMIYPDTKQGKKDRALPILSGKFNPERLRLARSVLRYSVPLAQEVMSGKTALNEAASMNGARRDLTPSQRAAMAVVLLPYLEQEAAQRQAATKAKSGEKVGSKVTQKVESRSERNEQTAAATVGTNRQYVADAKKVESKKDDPEVRASTDAQFVEALRDGCKWPVLPSVEHR